ncbi:MAG: D-alanyl-D-alanine carboxypeptidase [Ruminococcaceae bacterium]|nr:D-alanyl-D-alanine carboxypeptidase [Oscillospiraceae bacterium]
MKRIKYLILVLLIFAFMCVTVNGAELTLNSKSACLMEASTGKILYEINADEKLEPASVTKIMSLILVFEAMDEGKFDMNTPVSGSEHACSMGGSQIWLEPGETMTVNEMLKAVIVASANDCTVALGELVAGSEESFVSLMNERANELGMANTHFVNCTGLPAENHYTTARDIAIMTRELHKHKAVYDYTRIWTDTLRNGEFGISNTNKLIRFYNGATGMKTGYTSSALYCMSATAEREGMGLIAAVMKAESSDKRFADAKKLLEYGFANYSIYVPEEIELDNVKVLGGKKDSARVETDLEDILIEKGNKNKVEVKVNMDESIKAPFEKNTKVGNVSFTVDGKEIANYPVVTCEEVEKITFSDIFLRLLKSSIAVR